MVRCNTTFKVVHDTNSFLRITARHSLRLPVTDLPFSYDVGMLSVRAEDGREQGQRSDTSCFRCDWDHGGISSGCCARQHYDLHRLMLFNRKCIDSGGSCRFRVQSRFSTARSCLGKWHIHRALRNGIPLISGKSPVARWNTNTELATLCDLLSGIPTGLACRATLQKRSSACCAALSRNSRGARRSCLLKVRSKTLDSQRTRRLFQLVFVRGRFTSKTLENISQGPCRFH